MEYDIIVIGGGHAGCEAALACSRLQYHTLMMVGSINYIASMPCNPSIGGPAKGIIVREIDALGGEMAKVADQTLLQIKMLNGSKGPAVRALRCQSDKLAYSRTMREIVLSTPNLEVREGLVEEIIVEDGHAIGIKVENGVTIKTKSIIIASGTYLSSQILCGSHAHPSGPDNERTTTKLSASLRSLGLELIRLKTGTPPRLAKDSLHYEAMTIQEGDKTPWRFSEETTDVIPFSNHVPCYLTYTSPETHRIIRENIHKSSMYSGLVTGVGPRYCPSIEDKIVRFADKERHQIFIEPESLELDEVYVQGFSTSLPHEVQDIIVRTIPGLEDAIIRKYAYAIEYDAINPLELKNTLETKKIDNLFFAGQVNGTSGYEEAACQGLIAGINASRKLSNLSPLILKRDEAYIGVLIDDLITKGVRDPYRMLTSRAEFRLLLRHDNAEERLLSKGYEMGLISEERYQRYQAKKALKEDTIALLKDLKLTPKEDTIAYLEEHEKAIIHDKMSAYELLRRPDIDLNDVRILSGIFFDIDHHLEEEILIAIKYEGYIQKELKAAKSMAIMESKKIPDNINYDAILNIAKEAKDKLKKVHPETIGQASRISGVNPSDISILLVYLESVKRNGLL
ncbi:MAG: tRNA uridine-5-carboxymethylaminomethyl(34) synthesis enzyme MnmG [Bacilli bacterium]|nr:tRNA uridine-5-carboxymethylaminomethyl(34) synthesis enzyme MnmG [Bacilli bacterium]